MRFALLLLVGLLSLTRAGTSAAQDKGSFVMRLGRDTVSVENYARGANKVEIEAITRTPRVMKRQLAYDYNADGGTTRASVVITVPAASGPGTPVQQLSAAFQGDSLAYESRRDTVVTRFRVALPAGALIATFGNPWPVYEGLSMRLKAQASDSLRRPLYFLGSRTVSTVVARKLGRDSVVIENETDRYHAHVDAKGRIQHVTPLRGTSQYTVDRVPSLDLTAVAAGYQAMGALSTRDTVHAQAGGATLWVDYGRPFKRGRVVYGGVVPWGVLWRTGANAATQFRTDKPLDFGGTAVPAGFYTLWTVPGPKTWKLVINGETGQWGTAHKADKDLFTFDMPTNALAAPVEQFTISITPGEQGGTLNLDWDSTRASIPFTVKP